MNQAASQLTNREELQRVTERERILETRQENHKQKRLFQDFPGSPVLKTPCFLCSRVQRFDPWSGNSDPACLSVQSKKQNIIKKIISGLDNLPMGDRMGLCDKLPNLSLEDGKHLIDPEQKILR